MCFSATANFVGSGVLGAVGVVTLTRVKHRRELLFAALPVLFAVHQFIEGFVWLGLDGILSPAVAHNMGSAFMLYAQGLLPFLLPLSVLLFEPTAKSRRRAGAILYVIATCGSLFFSKIKMMVIFGWANLLILLVVMEIKRYAFTSLWCAYAAVARVIILVYFWKSQEERPFLYA